MQPANDTPRLRVLVTTAETRLRERLEGPTPEGPLVRLELSLGSQHQRRFLPRPLAVALALELRAQLRREAPAEPWHLLAVVVATGQAVLLASGRGLAPTRPKRQLRRSPRKTPALATALQGFGWLRDAADRRTQIVGKPRTTAPATRPLPAALRKLK
ncbi:MAG: hypothetical protein SFY70_10240 [Bacteroidia bacterium]|nr:hypothetical protein [Bacteroidia bacterium]